MNVYFDTDGKQVKGHFAADNRFYDKNNGWLVTNRIVNMYGDKTYYIDENGYKYTGVKEINGALYYFEPEQVFNKFAKMVVIMMIKVNKLISEQTASST